MGWKAGGWILLVCLAGCRHAPVEPTHYAVRASHPLPGGGHWDLLAVDPSSKHVFLTRGDRVQVMDAQGHLAGTIAGTDGAHGVAIVPELHRGFVTNGRSDSVTEFDLKTLARIRNLPVSGHSPDAILYEPGTRHLFVFNAHSDNVSVLEPASGKEIATIRFKGNPELAATDSRGRLYVNIENQEELVAIDTSSLAVVDTWLLPDCEGPTGLALDADNERVFSACQNGVLVVTDALEGGQVARVPIGEGPDGAAFDPATRTIFVPAGKSGTLTVIREEAPNKYRVAQTLVTERGARTIALDPVAHRLYLPTANFAPQPSDGSQRPPMLPDSFHVLAVW